MVNVELLEQTLHHIIDNPETHTPDKWVNSCGTAACFAGWACLLSGAKYLGDVTFLDTAGGSRHPQGLAAQLLGLTFEDAEELFSGNNTVDDLQNIIKGIINNAQSNQGSVMEFVDPPRKDKP